MAESKLIINVAAKVDSAKQEIKSVGNSMEQLDKQVKKVDKSFNLWDESIKKSRDDYKKQAVDMLAGAFSIYAIGTAISKTVKLAMESDAHAATTLKGISDTWKDIKTDLAGALMDTVSPALENLYKQLVKIRDWADRTANEKRRDAAIDTNNLAALSNDDLLAAWSQHATTDDEDWFMRQKIGKEVEARYLKATGNPTKITTYMNTNEDTKGYKELFNVLTAIQSVEDDLAKSAQDAADAQAHQAKLSEDYASFLKTYGAASSEYLESTYQGVIDQAQAWIDSGDKTEEEITYLNEIIETYKKKIESLKPVLEEVATATSEAFEYEGVSSFLERYENSLRTQEDLYMDVVREAENLRDNYSEQEEQYQRLTNIAEAYRQKIADIKDEAKRSAQGTVNSLQDIGNVASITLGSISTILSSYNSESEAAFEANKANNIAQAIMNTATGATTAYKEYGWPVGAAMAALITAAGMAQVTSIQNQEYTSMATGGIVDRPTHALIGEGGEKEVVSPLSKLSEYIKDAVEPSAGQINIVVNVDGGSSKSVAEDVYYAIERAQKTGALPKWRHV